MVIRAGKPSEDRGRATVAGSYDDWRLAWELAPQQERRGEEHVPLLPLLPGFGPIRLAGSCLAVAVRRIIGSGDAQGHES